MDTAFGLGAGHEPSAFRRGAPGVSPLVRPAAPLNRTRLQENAVEVAIWLPAMLLLGLAAVGLMFLFVEACDKV
jgi:hypothetical protein